MSSQKMARGLQMLGSCGRVRTWRRTCRATTRPSCVRTAGGRRRTPPPTCCRTCGPGMRVLDLGCGPGTITRDLGALVGPDGEVLGVDSAARRRRAGRRRVRPAAGPLRRRRRAPPRSERRLVRRRARPPGAPAPCRPGRGAARDAARDPARRAGRCPGRRLRGDDLAPSRPGARPLARGLPGDGTGARCRARRRTAAARVGARCRLRPGRPLRERVVLRHPRGSAAGGAACRRTGSSPPASPSRP